MGENEGQKQEEREGKKNESVTHIKDCYCTMGGWTGGGGGSSRGWGGGGRII